MMKKIRPILSKNGISISQRKHPVDGAEMLTTRIWHSSGQWIESRVFLRPTKNTVEAIGSNLNYMKRFEIMGILNVTVSEDPFDDDGEADMEKAHDVAEKGTEFKDLYNKKEESYEALTNDQYRELIIELDNDEDIVEDILEKLHIKSLREIPKSRFAPTIARIRKIQKVKKN